MPVYEYECPACEKVLEVQQRISDDPLSMCPDCGGKVKKLVSMSSFHLKGGGWYSDGYSSKSKGEGEKSKGEGKDSPASVKKNSDKGKETNTAPPPCQGGDSTGCKNCPASS